MENENAVENSKCPYCKEILEDLDWMIVKENPEGSVGLDRDGDLKYDNDSNLEQRDYKYFCPHCVNELNLKNEDVVKEFLQGKLKLDVDR